MGTTHPHHYHYHLLCAFNIQHLQLFLEGLLLCTAAAYIKRFKFLLSLNSSHQLHKVSESPAPLSWVKKFCPHFYSKITLKASKIPVCYTSALDHLLAQIPVHSCQTQLPFLGIFPSKSHAHTSKSLTQGLLLGSLMQDTTSHMIVLLTYQSCKINCRLSC